MQQGVIDGERLSAAEPAGSKCVTDRYGVCVRAASGVASGVCVCAGVCYHEHEWDQTALTAGPAQSPLKM